MRATQSSTALEFGTGSPHSAALQPESGLLQESPDGNTTKERTAAQVLPEAMAEDARLVHDVGNLLGALELYADLLTLPGVLYEEYREYAGELRLLSERSRDLMARLIRQREPGRAVSEGQRADLPESVESDGKRSFRLVEAEAGWIAC